jgi:hypothetical protein
MKRLLAGLVLCAGVCLAEKPNVLLIMVDDLGYSDLGCYGSEIRTPTLDMLAANGLRFTQFYNTAKCHSSRVCLMTGLYCHQAGSSSLSKGVTVAEMMRDAGWWTTSRSGTSLTIPSSCLSRITAPVRLNGPGGGDLSQGIQGENGSPVGRPVAGTDL